MITINYRDIIINNIIRLLNKKLVNKILTSIELQVPEKLKENRHKNYDDLLYEILNKLTDVKLQILYDHYYTNNNETITGSNRDLIIDEIIYMMNPTGGSNKKKTNNKKKKILKKYK